MSAYLRSSRYLDPEEQRPPVTPRQRLRGILGGAVVVGGFWALRRRIWLGRLGAQLAGKAVRPGVRGGLKALTRPMPTQRQLLEQVFPVTKKHIRAAYDSIPPSLEKRVPGWAQELAEKPWQMFLRGPGILPIAKYKEGWRFFVHGAQVPKDVTRGIFIKGAIYSPEGKVLATNIGDPVGIGVLARYAAIRKGIHEGGRIPFEALKKPTVEAIYSKEYLRKHAVGSLATRIREKGLEGLRLLPWEAQNLQRAVDLIPLKAKATQFDFRVGVALERLSKEGYTGIGKAISESRLELINKLQKEMQPALSWLGKLMHGKGEKFGVGSQFGRPGLVEPLAMLFPEKVFPHAKRMRGIPGLLRLFTGQTPVSYTKVGWRPFGDAAGYLATAKQHWGKDLPLYALTRPMIMFEQMLGIGQKMPAGIGVAGAAKRLFTHFILPAMALRETYRYADYKIRQSPAFDRTPLRGGITEFFARTWTETKLQGRRFVEGFGGVKAAQRAEALMPGVITSPMSQLVRAGVAPIAAGVLGKKLAGPRGALIGLAIGVAQAVLLGGDITVTSERLKDIYAGEELIPIRRGRFWPAGHNPLVGGRIHYWRPHWFHLLTSRYRVKSLYGDEKTYWKHKPIFSILEGRPFLPFTDPHWLAKKHYHTRPYPYIGPWGAEIPIIGPLVAATVGKVIRPPRVMHLNQWMTPHGPIAQPEPPMTPRDVPRDAARRLGMRDLRPRGLYPGMMPGDMDYEAGRLLYNIEDWTGLIGYCFLPDSLIATTNSYKKIKEIEPGDQVVTHSGNIKSVLKTFTREINEEICSIRLPGVGDENIKCTQTHRFWAISIQQSKHKDWNWRRSRCCINKHSKKVCENCKERVVYKPRWVFAKDLKTGDYLLFPKIKPSGVINKVKISDLFENIVIDGDTVKQLNFRKEQMKMKGFWSDNGQQAIKNEIILDKDLGKFLGWYLAEGSIEILKQTSNYHHVSLVMNSREEPYAKDLIRIVDEKFGIKGNYTIIKSKHTLVLRFCSHLLAQFVYKFCGKLCREKYFPQPLLKFPKDFLEGMLVGYFLGDGCRFMWEQRKGKKIPRIRLKSTNIGLLRDAQLIFILLGFCPPTLVRSKVKREGHYLDFKGREACRFLSEVGVVDWDCEENEVTDKEIFLKNNYVYIKIKDNSLENYSGEVYNMAVEGDESYCTYLAGVHNSSEVVRGRIRGEAGRGKRQIFVDQAVMEGSGEIASLRREFWDLELGDMFGLKELGRRLLPRGRGEVQRWNPIPNLMGVQHPWLPGRGSVFPGDVDYYRDFHIGDPFTQIPLGEARLPGIGLESLRELHSGVPGQYSPLDRLMVLSDVSPFSEAYKHYLAIVRGWLRAGSLEPKWEKRARRAIEQRRAAMETHQFYPRQFKHGEGGQEEFAFTPIERVVGRAYEEITHGLAATTLPGLSWAMGKLLPKRDAVAHYERFRLWGTHQADWGTPYQTLIRPYMHLWRGKVDPDWIPPRRRLERNIEEYFDKLEYVKYRKLERRAQEVGDRDLEEVFGKKIRGTMFGLDPFGGWQHIMRAIPRRERDYFMAFRDVPVEQRQRVLEIVPEYMQRIYIALWALQDIKTKRITSKEFNRIRGAIDRNKSQELIDFFKTHYLPGVESKVWSPAVDLKYVKLKVVRNLGQEMFEFNLWQSQEQELTRQPYIPLIRDFRSPNVNITNLQSHLQRELGNQGLEVFRCFVTQRPSDRDGVNINLNVRRDQSNRVEDFMRFNQTELLVGV